MKKHPSLPLILTIAIHLVLITASSLGPPIQTKKDKPPIKIVTKLSPPLAPTIIQTTHNPLPTQRPPEPPTINVKPKAKPPEKKTPTPNQKTPIAKKKSPLPKKPPPKKKIEPKQVRKKLNENLAKFSPPNLSPKPLLKTDKIEKAQTTSIVPPSLTSSYFNQVSLIFQESLTLPEKGAIKLTISVQANGKIVNIKPISYESEKNLHYLQTVLPSLELPNPEGGQEIEFSIIFCDD